MRICAFLLWLILPMTASAASIFDTFWQEAADDAYETLVPKKVTDYVIEVAKTWGEDGIVLTESDVLAAMKGNTSALCNGKKNVAGQPLKLADGTAELPTTCRGLMQGIVNLVSAEKEAMKLADDLLALAVASELVTADEPREPMDIPLAVQGLKRLWQSTGAVRLPWDPAADEALGTLNSALSALETEELHEVVYRFHHGYYRDSIERDDRFGPAGDEVESALSFIAGMLDIDPNSTVHADIMTPSLGIPNVGLWARADDIGLLWNVPTSSFVMSLALPEEYPAYHEFGDNLAYPFSYEGSFSDATRSSPLCSRNMGRFGYLCRPIPSTDLDCDPRSTDRISLTRCEELSQTENVSQTSSQCILDYPIYVDNGTDLYDPDRPGELHPELIRAGTGTICQSGATVQYPAGIVQNLCYTDVCLRESMSGHTLIPGRNPVLAYQGTSPQLACTRPDPALGTFLEIPMTTPTPLPPYIGTSLVQEFTTTFCQTTGSLPHPLGGLCKYDETQRSTTFTTSQLQQLSRTENEKTTVEDEQRFIRSLPVGVALRSITDQSLVTHRTALQPFIAFLDAFSSLLLELLQAPPPDAMCPWTGPVPISATS
ncbi:MAG: hypothetical protein ABL890_03635 [Candidatus Peribacteraceae bacterium]